MQHEYLANYDFFLGRCQQKEIKTKLETYYTVSSKDLYWIYV